MTNNKEVKMNTGTVWSKEDTGKGFTFIDMMRRVEDIELKKSEIPMFDKIICSSNMYGVLEKLTDHNKDPVFSYTGVKLIVKDDLLPEEVKAIFVNGSGMEIVAMWIGDAIKFVES